MVATQSGRADGNKEQRTAPRSIVSLPIIVRSVPPKGAEACFGRTRDISADGIYFASDQEFIPGSELDFTLTIPAALTFGTEVFIRAQSKVVRVERRQGDIPSEGTAAIIERLDSIRAKPATP
jgi:hypothetical protein